MANFWNIVKQVISDSDVLLEIIDARMVDESRNPEIEQKVRHTGKTLIYVINKCDLVEKNTLDKFKKSLRPCVFLSATERLGTSFLRKEIMKHAPNGMFKVGVLGYPNTGKSSIINALKGKKSAPTASISGYTKSLQLIRVSKRMYLLDTPGVFPYNEKDEAKHTKIAAKTFGNLKDPEGSAMGLLKEFPFTIENYYGVSHTPDPEEVLEFIAIKLKKLRKGGLPDLNSAARIIIQDWQKGKIKN
ncbi:MAG: GTPase [Candidatus Woesearchaeota archaeon]